MPSPVTAKYPVPKDWNEFEDIVADLFKRIWQDPYLTRNGRQGQQQHGVDIYGQPKHLNTNAYAGIQCKNYSSVNLKEIEDSVSSSQEFKPCLKEFIFATTAPRDSTIQEKLRNHSWPYKVVVWFWEDLCLELSTHSDLLEKHFPGFVQTRPTEEKVVNLILSSTRDDYRITDGTYVLKNDLNLRIVPVMDNNAWVGRKFDEPWVHVFPDEQASCQSYYIEYGASRVREMPFVATDGARYMIPLPKGRDDLRISKLQYHVAKIVNSGWNIDSGLKMARIIVDDKL